MNAKTKMIASDIERLPEFEQVQLIEHLNKRFFVDEHIKDNKYSVDVSDKDTIDLYNIADLYNIQSPPHWNAFKKITMAGKRGHKDRLTDLREAKKAIEREIEMEMEMER